MGIATTCLQCGKVIRSGSYCDDHKPKRVRASRHQRGYGSDWDRLSRQIQDRDGHLCQLRLVGCTGTSQTTDHIIPKALGGTDNDWNLQAACRHCNSVKAARLTEDLP